MIDVTLGNVLQAFSLVAAAVAILLKMSRNQGEARAEAKQLREAVAVVQKAIESVAADQEKLLRLDVWAPSLKGLEDRCSRTEKGLEERCGRLDARIDRLDAKVFDGGR